MAERRAKAAGAGATKDRPPMTADQFEASPEFRKFKSAMRKLLKVPKAELDHRVRTAKETSPRFENPKSPGRKKNTMRKQIENQ